jgi:hypothetical protein
MPRDTSESGSELLLLAMVSGAAVLISGCGGGASAPVQSELALTTADENQLAPQLRTLYPTLFRIAEPMRERRRPESEPLRVRVATTNGTESLVLQLVRNGAGDYPHLRVYRPRTGEHANFVFGGSLSQGITLRLTDDQGRLLQRDGERLEFSLFNTRQRTRAPRETGLSREYASPRSRSWCGWARCWCAEWRQRLASWRSTLSSSDCWRQRRA